MGNRQNHNPRWDDSPKRDHHPTQDHYPTQDHHPTQDHNPSYPCPSFSRHFVAVLLVTVLATGTLAGCSKGNIVGMTAPSFLKSSSNASAEPAVPLYSSTPPANTASPANASGSSGNSTGAGSGSDNSSNTYAPIHISKSVGIGDALKWVQEQWGNPSKVVTPVNSQGFGTLNYRQESLSFANGRISSIEMDYKSPVSKENALAFVKKSLPQDAQLVNHWMTASSPATATYYYSSESVRGLFAYAGEAAGSMMGGIKAILTTDSSRPNSYTKVTIAVGTGLTE